MLRLRLLWYVCINYGNNVTITFHITLLLALLQKQILNEITKTLAPGMFELRTKFKF